MQSISHTHNSYCIFLFSDLSIQDSLLLEYKKVCSVRSVRIVSSGRSGRYAVIYVVSMSDVSKALEDTRSSRMKNVMGGASLEADIYLAADELIEDK